MKRLRFFFTSVAFWVASLVSCSTASAFTGPVSDHPLISISYMRSFVQDDPRLPEHLRTITTANVTNASTLDMSLTLDCTESFHTLTVKARTTEHVMLDPRDASCELR